MLKKIDEFLNLITMYRLVLYGLISVALISIFFGFLGIIFYTGQQQLFSLTVLITTCYFSNIIFAKIFKLPANVESSLITSLILFFILTPTVNILELKIIFIAGLLSSASKYFLAIYKKHVFNPVAITLVIMGLFGSGEAIWWVATSSLLPFVTIVGLLIVRKIKRSALFISYFIASIAFIFLFGYINKRDLVDLSLGIFTSWPLLFFGTVMVTEPLATPPTKGLQIVYGAIVGILFGSQFSFWKFYSTPELALVIGNIFSFIVSPKVSLKLKLRERIKLGSDMYEFIFAPDKKIIYMPGQYLEWTYDHKNPDSRGNRRYFTIASSPTEKDLRLGLKIDPRYSSSFKSSLLSMKNDEQIFASQLTGDFILPSDVKQKLVFIAGGIGITPFRSMIKYLSDKNEKRDIILFYVAPSENDFVYKNILNKVKTVYVITRANNAPKDWSGKVGYINEQMIKDNVSDFMERKFYLSGPDKMVKNYQELLKNLNVKSSNIIVDYFPGF